ncbi:MAG: exo-beta-N-acetylmuramidase NamZ domain-containing protein [Pirellulaceae bacterium]
MVIGHWSLVISHSSLAKAMSAPVVHIGLEVALEKPPVVLRDARFGLLMNQASLDRHLRYACDLLAGRFPRQLAAIFAPQHGLWCEEQDNMIETHHGRHERLGIPVHSLYSETRRPTPEMLHGLECLVVDLQDVGTRVYTFAWTLSYCLEACARARLPVVVLDRPNPLGGVICEGPLLQPGYASLVGRASIPMRHGLTLGELAELLNEELSIGAELHVVAMEGWRRQMLFPETGRRWVPPSPNLPSFHSALVYPGQVLIEGTRLSEGRGTTTPFEVVGAPFIDSDALLDLLREYSLPGLKTRAFRFRPTFNKWQEQRCRGLALHAVNPQTARSYLATVAIIACIRTLYPDDFQWLDPPYEYENERMPIDILSGSSELRRNLEAGRTSPEDVERLAQVDETSWQCRSSVYWKY